MPAPLKYLVEAVVALSLVTLLTGILYLVIQLFTKRGVGTLRVMTIVTGILTAAGTLFIKGSGAKVTTTDESRKTVTSFYDYVQDKEFPQAFDLIHDAHKDELMSRGRGYEDFKRSYASTRDYRNMQIDFDQAESIVSRLYWVAFDVKDSFPVNSLMDDSWRSSGRMIDSGLINEERIINNVMSDLKEYYDLPQGGASQQVASQVKAYVRKAPLHYILEPSFTEDVGDALHLNRKAVNGVESWSHHIEHVKLLKTDTGWKIRSGLYPDTFVGTYPPGADRPSITGH